MRKPSMDGAWLAAALVGLTAPGCEGASPMGVVAAQASPAAGAVDQAAAGRFVGVILARESVDLGARLDGRVEEVRVHLGQQVTKGALLVTLDATALRGEVAVGAAVLRAARAEQEKAQLELGDARARLARRQQLSDHGATTDEDLAAARSQEKLAAARLELTMAQVAEKQAREGQLRLALEDTAIRAPFDGLVAARLVDPGASVARGAALLHLIGAADPWVRFAVPEGTVVSPGQPVQVSVEARGGSLEGVVENVAPEVDAASRMITVEARLALTAESAALPLSGRVAQVTLARREPRR